MIDEKVEGISKVKILSLGEVLWDVFSEKEYLGGAPLNFSAVSQRLGILVIVSSRYNLSIFEMLFKVAIAFLTFSTTRLISFSDSSFPSELPK